MVTTQVKVVKGLYTEERNVPHVAWGRVSRVFALIDRESDGWQQQEKPLEEDGGKAPGVRLSVWSYKSKLLTPKPKA